MLLFFGRYLRAKIEGIGASFHFACLLVAETITIFGLLKISIRIYFSILQGNRKIFRINITMYGCLKI